MSETPPAFGDMAAVVVTYFPDALFSQRLGAIAREFPRVVVVDNSADEPVRQSLRRIAREHGATLIENECNAGLAAALNQAMAHLATDIMWVATFDQDSTPEPGFATELRRATDLDPRPAVVGANWRDECRPDAMSRHLQPHRWLSLLFRRLSAEAGNLTDVTCVITSGSLFHVPTLKQLGGFDEALFLDLVDTDYCLRARTAGRGVTVAAGARLMHRRGAKRAVRLLGRNYWPAFMPPSRLHYLFRNRVLLLRRHGWRFPHWVAFEVVYTLKILTEILLFEDGKAAKLAACWKGTFDGIRGRSGPLR